MSDGVKQQVNDLDVGLLAQECHARIEKVLGQYEAMCQIENEEMSSTTRLEWVAAMYDRVYRFDESWLALCNAVVPVAISRRG